jgi:curved DNA-binding protein CbpA
MTHYEVLQVLPTASPEVIQMAYKALARKYHPDVFQGNKEYAETRMVLVRLFAV